MIQHELFIFLRAFQIFNGSFFIKILLLMGLRQTKPAHSQIIETYPFRNVDLCKRSFKDNDFERICVQRTDDIRKLSLRDNSITSLGLLYLHDKNWSKLTSLALSENMIGDLGCKFLTRATMESLTNLSLAGNSITSLGGLHLSKGQWKDMKQLSLSNNWIANIQWVSKGNWKKISSIYLASNLIELREAIDAIFIESKSLQNVFLNLNLYNLQVKAGIFYLIQYQLIYQ